MNKTKALQAFRKGLLSRTECAQLVGEAFLRALEKDGRLNARPTPHESFAESANPYYNNYNNSNHYPFHQ